MRSLWLGTGAAYCKVFPQLAITYFIFELASEQLGVGGLKRYDGGRKDFTSSSGVGARAGVGDGAVTAPALDAAAA